MQTFKYRNSLRVTLFHITDDHVTADQLIESKHSVGPRIEIRYCTPKSKKMAFEINCLKGGESTGVGEMAQFTWAGGGCVNSRGQVHPDGVPGTETLASTPNTILCKRGSTLEPPAGHLCLTVFRFTV
jgi:hypothetical protein